MRLIKNARIFGQTLLPPSAAGIRESNPARDGVTGAVVIVSDRIADVLTDTDDVEIAARGAESVYDARGGWLLPGVIDCHVHFREPGLTAKADITTESRAAVAGGVTTVLDMPNVKPATTSQSALEAKLQLFAMKSMVNYGLFFGITRDNIDEALAIAPDDICGYKVFLGSSTGGMLMNDPALLARLFSHTRRVVAVHSEDETLIRRNAEQYRTQYKTSAQGVPIASHPLIRSREACLAATEAIIKIARENGGRLHLCHLSTAEEVAMAAAGDVAMSSLADKAVSTEACVAHLWFTDHDYARLGAKIKCNPAVKTEGDRTVLRHALADGRIDLVATDHAPHLAADKAGDALVAASGMPSVQYSLLVMLELARRGVCDVADVVRLMCQNPALRYGIADRGFVCPGGKADLVLVHPRRQTTVAADGILSKCGWSPFEGETFHHTIAATWVGGRQVYDGVGVADTPAGEKVTYEMRCAEHDVRSVEQNGGASTTVPHAQPAAPYAPL